MSFSVDGAPSFVGPFPGENRTTIQAPTQAFPKISAFKAQVGKGGTVWLEPGKSFRISLKDVGIGARLPEIAGLNKNSPFTVTVKPGFLVITAKPDAAWGNGDAVDLLTGGSLTTPNNRDEADVGRSHFKFNLKAGLMPMTMTTP